MWRGVNGDVYIQVLFDNGIEYLILLDVVECSYDYLHIRKVCAASARRDV
jgi:hypothetical protein